MRAAVLFTGGAVLVAGCARRAPLTALREMPQVRVGIVVDQTSGSVSASGQFRVIAADGAILAVADAGATWRATPAENGRIRLIRPDRAEPLIVQGPLAIQPERRDDFVVIELHRYRGDATISRGSTGITVTNRVPLEWYVQSVVSVELGFRAPSDRQAVMAQAVAARTYVLKYRGRRQALGFDVFPTVADQVYPGADSEKTEVTDATRQTMGQVLTYRGELIEALFHSTCGWSTEANDQVFQSEQQVPYLRAVSDRFGPGRADYYCSISPRFRWREEWDGAAINAVLARTLPSTLGGGAANPGRVTNLRVTKTTPTGRAAELVIETTAGSYAVPSYRVREVLRPDPERQLLSTLFQLHVERQGGELVRVVAAGAGYGHGVGMCQFGAVGRARAGQRYERILATYYPGTKLERIY